MNQSLTRWTQWGIIALLAIMPFHAFLSVWLGHTFGHMQSWQAWKEILLAVMSILAAVLVFSDRAKLKHLRQPAIILAIVFAVLAVLVTLLIGRSGLKAELVGAKTDLEFLLAFILAAIVADQSLRRLGQRIVLITAGVVSLFGVVQALLLPKDFLARFGYGPTTVQPYETIVGHVRVLSTLGGPNQLGAFLILPIAMTTWLVLKRRQAWPVTLLAVELLASYYSFSRSAWLGAVVAIILVILLTLRRKAAMATALVMVLLVGGFGLLSHGGRDVLLHGGLSSQNTSDTKHILASESGLRAVADSPLGQGLGSAGPASYYSTHPLIPEDYYLQLAVETGWAGMLLFLAIETALGLQLWRKREPAGLAVPLLAALVGVAAVNLFLQGWADSSTALEFWTLAGLTIGGRWHAA